MFREFQRFITDVNVGRRSGFFPAVIKAGLWLLSLLYRLAVCLRNWAYDQEWFGHYQPPIPVIISVGNIVVGGTGKTPTVITLCQEFYDEAAIGILTRGYASPAEKLSSPVLLSCGKGPLHSAAYCGDEPYLMAQNLPKTWIYVGKNRMQSANLAAKAGADLVILDDGMQHRSLGRDYEVVVLDADDPFGHGYFLPRGFLRDSPRNLSRADLILLNHIKNSEHFEQRAHQVGKYTTAPIVGARVKVEGVYDLDGQELDSLQGKKVGIFCGVGSPERFQEVVKCCGAEIIGTDFFNDHAMFNPEKLIKLAEKYRAAGAEFMLCTQKDSVKLYDMPLLALPIVWLKTNLKIAENQLAWEQFIEKVRMDLRKRALPDF